MSSKLLIALMSLIAPLYAQISNCQWNNECGQGSVCNRGQCMYDTPSTGFNGFMIFIPVIIVIALIAGCAHHHCKGMLGGHHGGYESVSHHGYTSSHHGGGHHGGHH